MCFDRKGSRIKRIRMEINVNIPYVRSFHWNCGNLVIMIFLNLICLLMITSTQYLIFMK